MKNLILSLVFLALLTGSSRAGVVLSTSNPLGMPLDMSAGTTSGSMFVTVSSDNPPNDVMSAWYFQLVIMPESGATGTLTFQDPAVMFPPDPTNYIFGSDGYGIMATNGGTQLGANDFFYNPVDGTGAIVPGTSADNLLQMDFLASSNASGMFGIYALEGAANTIWNDASFAQQFFTNVPDGTGMVLIGEVSVAGQSVPEPSSLALLGLAAVLAGWRCRSRWRPTPARSAST